MKLETIGAGSLVMLSQAKQGAVSKGDLIELRGGRIGSVVSVNARARSVQARPIEGASVRGLDKAGKAFRAFAGMEPDHVITTDGPGSPSVAWLLGELEEVVYNTMRDGKKERYLHTFAKRSRPVLAVDAESAQLVIVGGRYNVTERGITDY